MEHKSKGVSGGMANESICAEFPDTWEEFVEKWAYDIDIFNKEDRAETAHEKVMDVYRVKQMMWYYLRDYVNLGVAHPTDDYEINIVENPVRQGGAPFFKIDRRINNGI